MEIPERKSWTLEKDEERGGRLSFESCRSSAVDHVEEMSSESARKMQDVQEVMGETAGNSTRGRGNAWRLEPEGETETLETKVVSDGVEGVHVDFNGECHHERTQVNNTRKQSEAPGEEGEESKSWKRKVIRVESEETQDCVCEANDMDQEEAEKKSFVSSAITVPQKLMFRCDNHCSEQILSFWQFASVVITEGEESYSTKECPFLLVNVPSSLNSCFIACHTAPCAYVS